MKELELMNSNARNDLYKFIASHGYYNNPYLKEDKS